jgi:hypothetical protein
MWLIPSKEQPSSIFSKEIGDNFQKNVINFHVFLDLCIKISQSMVKYLLLSNKSVIVLCLI